MGAVYDEFERELAALQKRCAGDARQEVIQLFLLALEREELVSVGYRESLMEKRLNELPIDPEIREIIRWALVWIWKDEEMHTIYIRGAILKIGGLRLKAQALLTQLGGGIGGWASSVVQHSRWSRAPLSRLIATGVTAIGRLVGKVPEDVAKHLQYGPFRNFCEFNIDAEKTAAVCWYRIAELAKSQPDLEANLARDFLRVAQDEDRHGDLFKILSETLTDEDTVAEGVTVDSLVEQLREVGEEFLPRKYRAIEAEHNPIGSGQAVHVVEGNDRSEKRKLFRRFLEESSLRESLERRAAFLDVPMEKLRVAIKPTFMLGYHRKDLSPLTDIELLDDLAQFICEFGCELVVIEGRNIYDHFFQNRSVHEVADYFGISSEHYEIADTADEQVEHKYVRGMAQYTIAKSWRDADFRISFPKLRSHPIEHALLSVANIEWVGGRCDEYLFLERQADRSTSVMMLLDEFPPHFGIIDAFENAPDGLVGMMGSRNPKHPLRFYAGADPLAVDSVAMRHLRVKSNQSSSVLEGAGHWFGGAAKNVDVIGPDTEIENWNGPYSNELWALLSIMAYPVYVLGSSRGSLFVPTMDAEAFPFIEPEGWLLRTRRKTVRWLLGLPS